MNLSERRTGRPQRASLWPAMLVIGALALSASQPAQALDLNWMKPIMAGAGPVVAEVRDVGGFDALRVRTDARVLVRQGDRDVVEVSGEGNVLPLIEMRLQGGSLVVEDARRFTSSTAEVVVTVRRLRAIAASGSTAVVAEGLHASALSLDLGGSSAVSLRGAELDRLQAALGGSSALQASGTVGALALDLGGSSSVRADQLRAKMASIKGGGSSQAHVWATDALSVDLGASASVGYYGTARMTQSTSGSSSVRYLGPAPTSRP